MGRMDKALVKLGSKPLLMHVVDRTAEVADKITVIIGRGGNISRYKRVLPRDVEVLEDATAELGPVGGILTGAQTLKAAYTAVLPCDSPFIEPRLVGYLFKRAEKADAAIPRWPKGYIEPLHSIYSVEALLKVGEATLRSGNLAVRGLIERMGRVVYIPTGELSQFDPELLTFFNINTLKDLEDARKGCPKLKIGKGMPTGQAAPRCEV